MVGALGALLLIAPHGKAVTIGTPLNVAPVTAEGCEIVVFPMLRPVTGVPPSCTFYSPNTQTPPGNYVVTTGRIRTGPRTGPMVFTAVRAMRSKATVNGMPAGIICCTSEAESQVFTPPPNSVVNVPIQLPMRNTTVLIDGEQVETIDYLGITLLDLQSSVPIAQSQTPLAGFFAPALRAGGQLLMNGFTNFSAVTLINGEFTPCGVAGAASLSNVAGCLGGGPGGGGQPGGGGGQPGGAGSNFVVVNRNPLLAGGTAARVIVRAPRAGVLRVRPVPQARRLLAQASSRATRGVNRLTVRLTQQGRRALNRRGQLRVPVIVTFRPQGGSASNKRTAITFRR